MKTNYNRSEILSFYDLPTKEQEERLYNVDDEEKEQIENDSYVQFIGGSAKKHIHYLPLSMFVKFGTGWMPNKSIWTGVYGTSYFSAYFIKISQDGTQAVIAEKYI